MDHSQVLPLTTPNDLTRCEVEVLRLVAQGLSDAHMAEMLVISPRTVNAYLRSIYSKLGIPSRHAAMHYAIEHHFASRSILSPLVNLSLLFLRQHGDTYLGNPSP